MRKKISTLLIFLAALTFYLSFNAYIPITDPVESNYALTAKEMVLSGDWLSPRIYGHYWFDKPIMIYWLIAVSFKLFGITEFAARLPAAVFSAGSVSFIYWFGQQLFPQTKVALLSALVLATSLEFWVLAKMIITDAVLFFYTSIALATLYLGLKNLGTKRYIIAYIAAGLAVLTKGPVGLILPGLIIISYIVVTRQWQLIKKLFLLPGLILFSLVAGPWYFQMYQFHGREFIDTFLGLHNYIRATVSEHPKDNVFYYYLVLFPISLLPWTGILFRYRSSLGSKKDSAHLSFLLVWSIGFILFYTLMATKYPTYVFPASFPGALLIGYTLNKMQTMAIRKEWWYLSIPTLLLISIICFSTKFLPVTVNWTYLYMGAILSSLFLLWLQLKGDVCQMPSVVAAVTVIMSLLLIYNGLIPLSSTRSGKDAASVLPVQGAMVASYGDYSTSAVFYSGYTIPRLVYKKESQEQSSPWSGKYTMPTEEIGVYDANTADNPQSYIIVPNKNNNDFMGESIFKKFRSVANYNNITVYQRMIAP